MTLRSSLAHDLKLSYSVLSFFFNCPASFYVTVMDVDCYCRMWPHTMTITLSTTPLDEWSARRKGLYQQQNTTLTRDRHPYSRQDSNPPFQPTSDQRPWTAGPLGSAGFEAALPANEWPQVLDRRATGIGGIRSRSPSKRVATGLRLRPHGHYIANSTP